MDEHLQPDEKKDEPKILIADDDPVIRELLQSIVEDEGWRCDLAANGAEAIDKVSRQLYDIVVTDLQMPFFDGIEVLRKVKETTNHTEVIILTGFSSETAAIHAVRLGAFDYLKKPLSDIDKLVALIRDAREKQQKAMHETIALVELRKEADELGTLRSRLEREAVVDPLTSLFNRAHFDKLLMSWFTRAEAQSTCFSIALIDVDNFKRLNDYLGHPGGDFVLRKLGEILLASIREKDAAFRLGGEEFVLLLAGVDHKDAANAAERIRLAIQSARLNWEGKQVKFTASIGVTSFPRANARDPADLLRMADQAMYRAKGKGKNRVEVNLP